MEMEQRDEQSISLSMSRIAEETTSVVINWGGKERTWAILKKKDRIMEKIFGKISSDQFNHCSQSLSRFDSPMRYG